MQMVNHVSCSVKVVKGKTHDKEWLIKRIQNACEEAFQPVDVSYFQT